MTPTRGRLTVGVGFQRKAKVDDIVQAIERCIHDQRLCREDISLVATAWFKRSSSALTAAGKRLDMPIEFFDRDRLVQFEDKVVTRSRHSISASGIACISESAALAAAGRGASLIAPRTIIGPVTCALATGGAL